MPKKVPLYEVKSFLLHPSGRIEKIPTVSSFHPLLEIVSRFTKMKSFKVTWDEHFSLAGHYTFFAFDNTLKTNDYRLFHFLLIGNLEDVDVNLYSEICISLNLMRKSMHSKSQIPTWNRLIIKVLPTLHSDLDYFTKHLEATIQHLKEVFKELCIEKFYVQFRIDSDGTIHDYTYKASHLLVDIPLLKLIPGSIDEAHVFHLESPKTKKIKQAVKSGLFWAYDLPLAMDEAARQIREEWNKSQECEDRFWPLHLKESSVRKNPQTGLHDPHYGELVLDTSQNPDSIHKEITTKGIITGIKINDLGNGILIKRLLIISDMTESPSITCEQCTYLNAAIRYAEQNNVPIDWFPGSYGTQISMERGINI